MSRLRTLIVGSAVAATAIGCTPDAYRRDADRQVNALIKKEEQRALGYTPAVETPITELSQPTRKSYQRIPTTAIPDLLTDVAKSVETPKPSRVLGPPANPVASQTNVLEQYSAVNEARAFTRDRYQMGPPASYGRARRMGLFDAIAYAVQNSRQYQTQMELLYTRALNVTLQRHLFEPRPFANARYGYSGGQAGVDYRSALTAVGEAGVRQRLPLGGEIVASGLVTFVNALNEQTADGETAGVALNGTIPFLRGAGFVNLEALIQSEREMVYAVRDFETFRRSFAIQVASGYFRLIARQQAIRNRYVRYQSSVELIGRTEALYAAGRITVLEVQRAQQEVLRARDDVDSSIENYENEVDRFKLLLGMRMGEDLEAVALQVDVPVPNIDNAVATALAKQYRLDLQTTRDRIEDARRGVAIAKNQLLPDLNLDLGTNIGSEPNRSARDLNSTELTYDATLRLDLPLDRLAERNQYRQSLIALEQAKRDVLQSEDQVEADVRASIRAIRSAIVSLELQRRGIENAQQRVEFANELLVSGRQTDSRDVVEAQNALLQAQDSYEQARADVQIAVLGYLRDTGVLRLDPASGELGLAMRLRPSEESERDRPATQPATPPPAEEVAPTRPTPLPLPQTDAG